MLRTVKTEPLLSDLKILLSCKRTHVRTHSAFRKAGRRAHGAWAPGNCTLIINYAHDMHVHIVCV